MCTYLVSPRTARAQADQRGDTVGYQSNKKRDAAIRFLFELQKEEIFEKELANTTNPFDSPRLSALRDGLKRERIAANKLDTTGPIHLNKFSLSGGFSTVQRRQLSEFGISKPVPGTYKHDVLSGLVFHFFVTIAVNTGMRSASARSLTLRSAFPVASWRLVSCRVLPSKPRRVRTRRSRCGSCRRGRPHRWRHDGLTCEGHRLRPL